MHRLYLRCLDNRLSYGGRCFAMIHLTVAPRNLTAAPNVLHYVSHLSA